MGRQLGQRQRLNECFALARVHAKHSFGSLDEPLV
jgi:hypothetical protein